MTAKVRNLDFSKVKDGGNFNKSRIPAGDYLAKIIKVEDAVAKDETPQYLFTIQIVKRPSSKLPYYCKLQENQLWKLRNIFIAAGKSVPKSKIKVDPNQIVNKLIGVTIGDTEYEGKEQSEIDGIFPAAELDEDDSSVEEPEEDEDDEDEADDSLEDLDTDEVEAEEEEDEEAGDEYDAMDRLTLRKALLKVGVDKTSKAQSDDDLRDLLRQKAAEAAKPKAAPKAATKSKAKKSADVSDEELDELDIDDL